MENKMEIVGGGRGKENVFNAWWINFWIKENFQTRIQGNSRIQFWGRVYRAGPLATVKRRSERIKFQVVLNPVKKIVAINENEIRAVVDTNISRP